MTEKKFDLSRRKVLGSIGLIGAGSAAAGAGTMAYFSDTEESTGNTVTAGTLDLTVNGHNDISGSYLDVSGVAPGWSEDVDLTLANAGNVGGNLYIKIDASGDLTDDLDLTYSIDGGGSGSVDLSNVPTDWIDTGQDIGGSGSVEGNLGLELPTSVGNEAQGETAEIDVAMQLVQSGGDP
ncbi:TasA family protein [Natrinema sp. CGMCC1.2065]|uniref:TasA family protein n=1 Tax=Natrinema sp. CGMCC1.2065 TaxID=3445767 RepID=UPI003F4A35CA